jgi:hypothetical protein
VARLLGSARKIEVNPANSTYIHFIMAIIEG